MPSSLIAQNHGSQEPCTDMPRSPDAAEVDCVATIVSTVPGLATSSRASGHMPASPLRFGKPTVYFHRPRPPTLPCKPAVGTFYMHVNNSKAFEVQASGLTFAFPLPSPQRILPSPSPSTESPSSLTLTPESPSLASIGVALGSPSRTPDTGRLRCHPPRKYPMAPIPAPPSRPAPSQPPSAYPPRSDSSRASNAIRLIANSETASSSGSSEQSRTGGWKSLAFWRAKTKPLPPDPPLSAVAEAVATSPKPNIAEAEPRYGSSASSQQRRPMPRGLARFKARMEAERAVIQSTIKSRAKRSPEITVYSPDGDTCPSGLGIAISPPRGVPNRIDGGGAWACSGCSNAPSPRVELEIPDARMERYSVMFEQLLLRPQSTLAERRRHKKSLTLNTNVDYAAKPSMGQQAFVRSPYRATLSSMSTPIDSLYMAHTLPQTDTHGSLQESRRRSGTEHTDERNDHPRNFCRPHSPPTLTSQDGSPRSPACADGSVPSTPATLETGIDSIVPKTPNGLDVPTQPESLSLQDEQWGLYRSHPTFEEQMVEVSVARQVSVNRASQILNQAMVTGRQPLQKPKVVQLGHHRHVAKKSHTALVVEDGDKS